MHNIPTTEALVRGLAERLRGKIDDDHDWTPETLTAAASLFPPGCTRHAARRTQGDGWSPEYLVDLCISDDIKGDENDPFTYRQLLLAMECEWGPSRNALKYDFSKLADTRAVRKIFVGYLRQEEAVESFANASSAFLRAHELVGEGEEYGVLIFASHPPTPFGWIVTKKAALPLLLANGGEPPR